MAVLAGGLFRGGAGDSQAVGFLFRPLSEVRHVDDAVVDPRLFGGKAEQVAVQRIGGRREHLAGLICFLDGLGEFDQNDSIGTTVEEGIERHPLSLHSALR